MGDPYWMNGDPYALGQDEEDDGIDIPDPVEDE
jgi:hypothetical protein